MLSFSRSSFCRSLKSGTSSISGVKKSSSSSPKSEAWFVFCALRAASSVSCGSAFSSFARFGSRLSKAPDFMRFSTTPRFTCRVSMRDRKSHSDANFPPFVLFSMMFATAASPTLPIAESPSLMTSPMTVKSSFDSLMSGGSTSYPASRTARIYCPSTSIFEPMRLERYEARYSAP